ncbi:MAG: hypothetical protein ACFFCZ_05015 [Promethearchaeota archaeon]
MPVQRKIGPIGVVLALLSLGIMATLFFIMMSNSFIVMGFDLFPLLGILISLFFIIGGLGVILEYVRKISNQSL